MALGVSQASYINSWARRSALSAFPGSPASDSMSIVFSIMRRSAAADGAAEDGLRSFRAAGLRFFFPRCLLTGMFSDYSMDSESENSGKRYSCVCRRLKPVRSVSHMLAQCAR